MNIIGWIVLGLIAGSIAKLIYPSAQGGGIIGSILLGITGAFVGGTLFDLLQTGTFTLTATNLSAGGIVVAVIGAMIAIFIFNMLAMRG